MSSQFLSNNYGQTSTTASITATSEASGFPKENALDVTRRTKVWRSGGYYLVESGSNEITFEETASTPLTATVAVGGYSSFSALATAIKTALEAVGGSVYTIDQNTSTLKARISSDGAGGGGIFNLLWTTSSGIGDILGFDTTSNDTGSTSYTADSLRITTGEYFLFDFGMGINPDAIVVSWRQDIVNQINDTATLDVKGNYTNNFTTSIYSASASKTEYGFLLRKDDSSSGLATDYLRYWRLGITDLDNVNGYIELGSIFIGDFIGFSRGCVQIPFSGGWEDGSITEVTEGGQSVGSKRYITRQFRTEWYALTQAEKELFDNFYERVRTVDPFYILLDPNQVLGSTVERHLAYVRFNSAPSWTMDRPGVFTLSCDLREDI